MSPIKQIQNSHIFEDFVIVDETLTSTELRETETIHDNVTDEEETDKDDGTNSLTVHLLP